MKSVLEWINQKWLWVIAAFLLTIFIHIGLRYYFWDWSANNFNNLVTPVASTITSLLFILLAIRQYRLMIQQNELIFSQNLKPHFEEEFKRVEQHLRKDLTVRPDSYVGEINSLNIIGIINDQLNFLKGNTHYREDLQKYKEGKRFNRDYYNNRSYSKNLDFVGHYCFWGILPHQELTELIFRINTSKMIVDDKKLFMMRIKNNLLSEYLSWFSIADRANDDFDLVPMPWEYQLDVEWKTLRHSGIGRDYVIFSAIKYQ